jgi:hypothetical protein
VCNGSTQKNHNGVFNFSIFPIIIASPFKHWCNWLERFARFLVLASIGCGFGGGFALESCLVCIGLGFYVLPFLHGLGTFNDLSAGMHFLGDGMGFQR